MKNLNALPCSDIAEFDLIRNSKHNQTRLALATLRPDVNVHYNNYLANFQLIHTIGDTGFNVDQNTNLLKCYTGTTKALTKLVDRVNKAQTVEFQYICGYCLYHTVSTIDHYIPKDEYPVFCVMPRNLLPCCSSCNSIKNDFWRAGTRRLFLHLYNDSIPDSQFLVGSLTMNEGVPIVNYQIVQPEGMTNELYKLIETHFDRLGLFDLYREGIGLVIAEIKKSVDNARVVDPHLSFTQIRRVLLASSASRRATYGRNYWQSIAIDLLAEAPLFLNTL